MIYPMMLKVEPDCLSDVRHRPKGIILTLTINWLVKPFTMAGLAYLFFRYVYADFVPAGEADEYIAGMILLGVAPCTAMVFVWSQLTNGNANYTLAQVSINDLILVFAFAPIAGLLLGVTDLDGAVGDPHCIGRDLRRRAARRRSRNPVLALLRGGTDAVEPSLRG